MGVYFPDMKFPQNCEDCDLLYDCCACGLHTGVKICTIEKGKTDSHASVRTGSE